MYFSLLRALGAVQPAQPPSMLFGRAGVAGQQCKAGWLGVTREQQAGLLGARSLTHATWRAGATCNMKLLPHRFSRLNSSKSSRMLWQGEFGFGGKGTAFASVGKAEVRREHSRDVHSQLWRRAAAQNTLLRPADFSCRVQHSMYVLLKHPPGAAHPPPAPPAPPPCRQCVHACAGGHMGEMAGICGKKQPPGRL